MNAVKLNSIEGKWIMLSTILASSMAFIDATALNVVLPSLQKDLHANGSDLFWILNAYLLMLASLILIGGAIGDRLGRKKVFTVGILIFVIGSAACGFAFDINSIVIFRLIQGLGGALMIPGSLSIISSGIDHKEQGRAIGIWSACTTVVTMGGPILGGALADSGLWRYIFFINVPIGLAAILVLLTKVRESKESGPKKPVDIFGAATIALSLAAATYGFLSLPSHGFWHIEVAGALFAGVILFIVFIIWQAKYTYPMMPLRLFKDLTFSGANLLTFFLYAGLGTGMLFLSLNLVQIQGYSQLQSGLAFLPFTLLLIALASFAGKLSDRYGPRYFLIIGPLMAGVGLFLLSLIEETQGPKDYWTTFFIGIIIFGLGMSFTVAPLTTTVMGSVEEHYSGTASGINNAISRIASVFANAIFGALAVILFSNALQGNTRDFLLNNKEKIEMLSQSKELGNARPPANLGKEKQLLIKKLYQKSFVHAYVIIMRIAAGLALTGALMALFFIRPKRI
jgi:EmrB/QacA subfamily drug resistance transporter